MKIYEASVSLFHKFAKNFMEYLEFMSLSAAMNWDVLDCLTDGVQYIFFMNG